MLLGCSPCLTSRSLGLLQDFWGLAVQKNVILAHRSPKPRLDARGPSESALRDKESILRSQTEFSVTEAPTVPRRSPLVPTHMPESGEFPIDQTRPRLSEDDPLRNLLQTSSSPTLTSATSHRPTVPSPAIAHTGSSRPTIPSPPTDADLELCAERPTPILPIDGSIEPLILEKIEPYIGLPPILSDPGPPLSRTPTLAPKNPKGPLRIVMSPTQIRSLPLDNRSGFLLSMVPNAHTVDELLDISGMSRLEAMKVICELLELGVIELG